MDLCLYDHFNWYVHRSHGTYFNPIEEENKRDYEKFLKTFSLSTYATEISEILDQEVDVSRYYAELVPLQITPNEFWARYFFKLMLLMRGGIAPLDDEDDEDLTWENDEDVDSLSNQQSQQIDMTNPTQTIAILQEENYKLKGTIKSLVARISELEALLTAQARTVKSSGDSDDDETLDAISVDTPSSPDVNTASMANKMNSTAMTVPSSSASTLPVKPSKKAGNNDIVIKREDIDMLVNELEMSQEEAKEALRECGGNLDKVLKKFAGAASLPSSPSVTAPQEVTEVVSNSKLVHSTNSSDTILVEKDSIEDPKADEEVVIVAPPTTKQVPDISLSDDEEESWD